MELLKLKHLTKQDHAEAARLLNQVQDALTALTRIVERAPFTDRVMRTQKAVQEDLIDPLREEEFEQQDPGSGSSYASVHYGVRRRR